MFLSAASQTRTEPARTTTKSVTPRSALVVGADVESTCAQLMALGLNVISTATWGEALTLMVERRFCLMLTDMQLTGTDGIELTRRVRERGVDDAYVVVLSLDLPDSEQARGKLSGVDEFHARSQPMGKSWIDSAFNTAGLRRELKVTQAKLAEAERAKAALIAKLSPELPSEPVAGDSRAAVDEVGATTQVLDLPEMPAPNVLLVSGDDAWIEFLQTSVASAGYEVAVERDPGAAISALQARFAPIVIVDRNVQDVDGLELCRSIRRHSWPSYVYLVLSAPEGENFPGHSALKEGVDDYLGYPNSQAQVLARLHAACRVLTLEHSLTGALAERRRLAMTDVLTGAHNRRYFMRYLGGEVKRARRFGTELSLLLLDLDLFKKVNEEFGHAAGDVVLQKFVKRLQKGLPRDYDWCARIGGEEFAVVLPQTDLTGAQVVAERLRKMVEQYPLHMSSNVRPITVSIGVSGLEALPRRDAATVETLLAHADRYLHLSKEEGRNRITVAPVNKLDS